MRKDVKDKATDVGTMWTMTRDGRTARCALLSLPQEWELRVLLDGAPLLTKRCLETRQAVDVAEDWKRRMAAKGWLQVRPPYPRCVA